MTTGLSPDAGGDADRDAEREGPATPRRRSPVPTGAAASTVSAHPASATTGLDSPAPDDVTGTTEAAPADTVVADTESQIVVAVDVTTQGSDHGQVEPMREQIERRYGASPGAMLVDGGFVSLADFDRVERKGCRIYAPPMQRPRPARPRDRRRHRRDTPALARWRRRMRTRAARAIYRLRAATAECVNAIARRRGLVQLGVRGRAKARCILLLHALTHNCLRAHALRATLASG